MARFVPVLSVLIMLTLTTSATGQRPMVALDTGGHRGHIRSLFFTPDGRRLISAGDDKVIRVWETATGRLERSIRGEAGPGPAGMIYAAALNPDGSRLAVAGWMGPSSGYDPLELGRVRLLDTVSGRRIGLLAGHDDAVLALAFSPDGRYLASAGFDRTVRLWRMDDPPASAAIFEGHQAPVYALAFSPDSQRLVSAGDEPEPRLWRTKDGALIRRLTGHHGLVRALVWTSGDLILTGASDRTIKVWNGTSGAFLKDLTHLEMWPRSLGLWPDGSRVLVGLAGLAGPFPPRVLAVPDGHPVAQLTGPEEVTLATAVSPDGRFLAAGSGRDREIFIWTVDNSRPPRILSGSGQSTRSVGISADGRQIAWGHAGRIGPGEKPRPLERSLDWSGEEEAPFIKMSVQNQAIYRRTVHESGTYRLRAVPGGDYGYNDATLQVLASGRVVAEIKRDAFSGYRHRAFTLTPDSRLVITGGDGGVLTAHDTATGTKVADFIGHEAEILDLAVSLDGRMLASGSADQTIRIWNLSDPRAETRREPSLNVFVDRVGEWAAWRPDGRHWASPGGARYLVR